MTRRILIAFYVKASTTISPAPLKFKILKIHETEFQMKVIFFLVGGLKLG